MSEGTELYNRINNDLTLRQLRGGLTFGTDAYLLAAYLRPSRACAVELGAGTGVVSLLCASKRKFPHITALEIQPEFAAIAGRNVTENDLGDAVTVIQGDVRTFTLNDCGGEAGTVFCNPPYMRTDSGAANENDAKNTARHEVYGGIADFCACASRILKTGGRFVCVYRPDRLADLMAAMQAARLQPKRMTFVHADAGTVPSMVLTEAVKHGATGLVVTPPLILYDAPADGQNARKYTPQAEAVYDTCRLGY